MNKLFLIKEKLHLHCLDKNKILGNLVVNTIDFFLTIYLINELAFKVIPLNTCCPLEPNEPSVYVESSSCLDSGQ